MASAISHDIDRAMNALAEIKYRLTSTDYADQRRAAGDAMMAAADLLIDMAETLNWLADTGEISNTDRRNIRAHVHDAFVEAVDAADDAMTAGAIAAQ